jgi:GTP cyclohydrolase II
VGDKNRNRLPGLFGRPESIAAQRALVEFRSGRPVIMTGADGTIVAMPVDGLNAERLAFFRRLSAPARPHLVITAARARVLGIAAARPVGLSIDDGDGAAPIFLLVAEARVEQNHAVVPAGPAADAAIELAKLAQQLPALLVADGMAVAATSCEPPLVTVSADAVAQFRQEAIASVAVVAEANVPLNGGLPARFVIFRDALGGASVAVIVGKPDFAQPIPMRLHSACLTGDVFGSPASMRAYRLQDAGLDTLDANTTLGFDDDERDYGIAARMLHMLGCTRVLLLTNNPAKLDGLARTGIEVSGRIALHVAVNADNRRYLTAKATRAGHALDPLFAAVAQRRARRR